MTYKFNISSEDLELTRLGLRDKYGLEVDRNDTTIFTYMDDNLNNHHILCRNRSELLTEIEKRSGIGNYQPWFYEKAI